MNQSQITICYFILFNTSNKYFQTLSTEEIESFSSVVWISCMSGPKDTQSSPGSFRSEERRVGKECRL